MAKTFNMWRKHLLCRENIYYAEKYADKTYITRRKHLIHTYTEKILLREETFMTWRKHLLHGENIYYVEKTFITRRKHLLRGENIYYMEKTMNVFSMY